MARISNETKLILKLAKARKSRTPFNEPHSYKDDQKLHEAYAMGFSEGQGIYEQSLESIVAELENQ